VIEPQKIKLKFRNPKNIILRADKETHKCPNFVFKFELPRQDHIEARHKSKSSINDGHYRESKNIRAARKISN
jgi:hypothetical protein